MRKIATAAALAALMAAPASVQAQLPVETVSVTGGVLAYASVPGQVDTVVLSDGLYGMHVLSETTSPSGAVGIGCSPISGYPSVLCAGATSASLRTDDLADSVVVTTALPVTVDAGAGADKVTGGGGADTLDGGAGADEVLGGAGDDRIEARDGVVDTIDCGAGNDLATSDAIDVVTNCEVNALPELPELPEVPIVPQVAEVPVDPIVPEVPKGSDVPVDADTPEPPKADPPGEPAPPRTVVSPLPPVAPVVALVSGTVRVGPDGVAPLELGCPAEEVAGCNGDVFLDPAPTRTRGAKGKAKGKGNGKAKGRAKGSRVPALAARRGRFGRSPFQIAAGKRTNLRVQLTPLARKRLGLPKPGKARAARRGRRIKATVTVVQRGKAAQRSVIELRG